MPHVIHKPSFSPTNLSGIVAATQDAQFKKMAVIANDLGNTNTIGYKGGEAVFTQILNKTPTGEKISYVHVSNVYYDFSQGAFKPTGVKTHFAVKDANAKEHSFFKVRTSKGTFYTRSGEFQLSKDGKLITGNGDEVLSDANDIISIPANAKTLNIDSDGSLYIDGDKIAKLGISTFNNVKELKHEGGNLYSTTQETIAFKGAIQQGVLEGSNVSSMKKIVELTEVQKSIDASQEALKEYEKRMKQMTSASARNV